MKRLFIYTYIFTILIFVIYYFYIHKTELSKYVFGMDSSIFMFSFTVCFLYFITLGLNWSVIQKKLSRKKITTLSLSKWFKIFMWGFVGRYIPGKLGLVFGRILFLENYGFLKKEIIAASIYENLFSILNGIFISLLILLTYLSTAQINALFPLKALLSFIVLLVLIFILSPFLFKIFDYIFGKAKVNVTRDEFNFNKSSIFFVFLLYSIPTLLSGVVLASFINSFLPIGFDLQIILLCSAVATLSGIIGTLTLFAPGGIGVRETVLVVFLSSIFSLGTEQAIFTSVVYRIFITTCEFTFLGVFIGADHIVEKNIAK